MQGWRKAASEMKMGEFKCVYSEADQLYNPHGAVHHCLHLQTPQRRMTEDRENRGVNESFTSRETERKSQELMNESKWEQLTEIQESRKEEVKSWLGDWTGAFCSARSPGQLTGLDMHINLCWKMQLYDNSQSTSVQRCHLDPLKNGNPITTYLSTALA